MNQQPDQFNRRTQQHMLLWGSLAAVLAVAGVGCQATPLAQWRAMSSSRVEPLTAREIAALDRWDADQPVTTVVRAGEVR